MTRGSHIISIDPAASENAAEPSPSYAVEADYAALDELSADQDGQEVTISRSRGLIALGLVLVIAGLAWTALFILANYQQAVMGVAPAQAISWITDWSAPVMLLGVTWLLATRNSRREARRFGEAAHLLNHESARLEARLHSVNSELSVAREFVAAQSRDLEALGRMAAERLSQNAERLAGLILDNGQRIDTIGSVSGTALDNMEKLRSHLPVIASSAKDVTNNIGTAGRAAQAQLEELVSGFNKLNQFGQASQRQVETMRGLVNATVAEFTRQADQLGQIAEERFIALGQRGEEFRTDLDRHEVEALASVRSRAAALSDELQQAREALDASEAESLTSLRSRLAAVRDESSAVARAVREAEGSALQSWRQAIDRLHDDLREALTKVSEVDAQALESSQSRLAELLAEAERVDDRLRERDAAFARETQVRANSMDELVDAVSRTLGSKLEELDAAIANRRTEHEQQSLRLVALGQDITATLAEFGTRIGEIRDHGADASQSLAESLAKLNDRLIASREALSGTGAQIATLTDDSVRLLELIQASYRNSSEELPTAIGLSEDKLVMLENRGTALRDALGEAARQGEALSSYVYATRDSIENTSRDMAAMNAGFDASNAAYIAAIEAARSSLHGLRNDGEQVAQLAREELSNAIEALTVAARAAFVDLEGQSAASVKALAERLGAESAQAIDKAMRERAAEVAGELEQATAHAAGISREAALQLRDQLAKVNELAANLERRVTHARERAEEQVDNDFARRVALITEALNSNAIDIARALDREVSDTAWASYLRGDRGVFTRRAVRLLENPDAKAVAQLYVDDNDFREHTSRYIHDFEAMLRQLLSTRDGHAMGVTLLSSDMGKLYVALAQSIERIRT